MQAFEICSTNFKESQKTIKKVLKLFARFGQNSEHGFLWFKYFFRKLRYGGKI